MKGVSIALHYRTAVSRPATNVVNAVLTMLRVASPPGLWHGAPMRGSPTKAGGCFLTLCILAGFPLGLALGNPMKGILIGTGAGIAAAVVLWLFDRQRSG
jgi:hypothetical protein